ncbi:hypothetical protein HPB47_026186 [Ixodes persulcatus]|uniref:Uncharacterized protein n=1 Tax=Ixodes persulcatus TaxID=34615 RepID=A0AC60Q1U6_IXOPE|nr:hypothetical protein HPB47_026186 [Ixodes persulcatus]
MVGRSLHARRFRQSHDARLEPSTARAHFSKLRFVGLLRGPLRPGFHAREWSGGANLNAPVAGLAGAEPRDAVVAPGTALLVGRAARKQSSRRSLDDVPPQGVLRRSFARPRRASERALEMGCCISR